MPTGLSRSLVVAAIAGAVALIVGYALCWTVFQALALACSLGLFAYWLRRLRVGEDEGVLGTRHVSIAVLVALVLYTWAAFYTDLAVHFRMGSAVRSLGPLGELEMPRFLSMGLTLLPAAPYAAYAIIALIPDRQTWRASWPGLALTPQPPGARLPSRKGSDAWPTDRASSRAARATSAGR